jgi:hypothetical protein
MKEFISDLGNQLKSKHEQNKVLDKSCRKRRYLICLIVCYKCRWGHRFKRIMSLLQKKIICKSLLTNPLKVAN